MYEVKHRFCPEYGGEGSQIVLCGQRVVTFAIPSVEHIRLDQIIGTASLMTQGVV